MLLLIGNPINTFICLLLHICSMFVAEAKATILGQSDLYVKMGSIVVLTCVISQGPHDLGTIMWYRGK